MGGTSSSTADCPTISQDSVKEMINQDCVVIFSKTTCPYCTMAKRVFEGIGTPYTCFELNKRSDGQAMQDILAKMTGQRTVPRVFVNGKCIGGGTETQKLHKDGKLVELLAECSQKTS